MTMLCLERTKRIFYNTRKKETHMKKRLLLILITCICIILSGCTAQTADSEITPPAESISATPTPAARQDTQPNAELFVKLSGLRVTAGILFDGKENMFIGKNGGILKITSNGEVSEYVSFNGISAVKNYYFKSPLVWDMVMDDEHILAAAQDRILKITKDGDIETIIEGEFEGFLGISGLEIDELGNLYFTNGSQIIKYSPDGEQQIWFDGSSLDFNSLFSLKFDADYENLYATDFFKSTLIKIPIDGEGNAAEPEVIIREPIKNASPYGAPLNMVFDNHGNLYSSLDCRASLLKVDKDGGTDIIPMNSPDVNHYIAFGGEGFEQDCIYFTTYRGTGIYKFRLAD